MSREVRYFPSVLVRAAWFNLPEAFLGDTSRDFGVVNVLALAGPALVDAIVEELELLGVDLNRIHGGIPLIHR
jgi:hypothetical protein